MRTLHSKDNATFKWLKSLLTRKGRKQSRRFLLEGARFIRSALEAGIRPDMLIFSEEIPEDASSYGMMSLYGLASCTFRLSSALFSELSDTEHSQGVLAVFDLADIQTDIPRSTPMSSSAGRSGEVFGAPADLTAVRQEGSERRKCNVVVLDVVQDPGNVGTILRTADAAGISRIYLVEGCADPFAPKAIRSTAGSILNLQLTVAPRHRILTMLREQGYRIVSSTLSDSQESRRFFLQCDADRPFALVLGNEANGVSDQWLEASDAHVHIPIYGRAESLNVAVAAGILMYQMQER